ncbi:hypothetical protein I5T79_18760 [Stenotrophomonas maltophilia]|nr:hypothetical protein [Stenotrophomonas maltophilia]
MWELLGQIIFVALNPAGHALGRSSGWILLALILVIAISCAALVTCEAG